MYSAYGAPSPLDGLAALQRDAAGLHSLVNAASAVNHAAVAVSQPGQVAANQQQAASNQSAMAAAVAKSVAAAVTRQKQLLGMVELRIITLQCV